MVWKGIHFSGKLAPNSLVQGDRECGASLELAAFRQYRMDFPGIRLSSQKEPRGDVRTIFQVSLH